jgi:hypothetical protein
MTIQPRGYSFTPWNPGLSEAEDTNCPICLDSLPETPETSSQIGMKHEGSDGEKHPAAHLGCLRSWLEKSSLCMHCQAPLNKEQLLLFLDELETLNFSSLSFQELSALATEVVNLLSTPEGNLRSAGILLKEAIKNLETAFANLSTASMDRNNLLEELVTNLTRQLETVSKEEYLTAEAFLTSITESELEERELTYRALREESNKAWQSYRKMSASYYIINSLPHITPFALSSLLDSDNPLTLSPQEPLREKAHELGTAHFSLKETDKKILTLKLRHFELTSKKFSRSLNLSLCLLIALMLTSLPAYLILCGPKKECERGKRAIGAIPILGALILAIIVNVNSILEAEGIIPDQTKFREKVAALIVSNISPQLNRIHRRFHRV